MQRRPGRRNRRVAGFGADLRDKGVTGAHHLDQHAEVPMFARVSTLGLVATIALSTSSGPSPAFTLESSGAVRLTVAGTEAHYSISPDRVEGKRELAIALGPTAAKGAIWLFTAGDELPRPGRYPVVYHWTGHKGSEAAGRWFHACYMPGPAEHPLGMFHSESGWVTITEAAPGHIVGTFDLRARGSLASNEKDENQWVTVRGTFTAEGDSTVATLGAVSSSGR
jgi:hypothetical protein